MTESLIITLFHSLYKNFLSLFVQKTFVEYLIKMTGT